MAYHAAARSGIRLVIPVQLMAARDLVLLFFSSLTSYLT